MATILVAVLGVFIILAIWVAVDLLARKQLGERRHTCGAHHDGHCGHCEAASEQQPDGGPAGEA